MVIEGIRRAAPPATPALRGRPGSFSVPAAAEQATGPAPTAAALPLDGILALQEQVADATRDRQARQHGHKLLQALAALQHALLQGADGGESVRHLAQLVEAAPPVCDPALAAILQAIALRAQVELARRGV